MPEQSVEEQWDIAGLQANLLAERADLPLTEIVKADSNISDADIVEKVQQVAEQEYQAKLALVGKEAFAGFERSVMLQKHRRALARTSGCIGSFATRHTFAWLRAKES